MINEKGILGLSPKEFQIFLKCITCSYGSNFSDCLSKDVYDVERTFDKKLKRAKTLEEINKAIKEHLEEEKVEMEIINDLSYITVYVNYYEGNGEDIGLVVGHCLRSKDPELFKIAEFILGILNKNSKGHFGWDS